MALVAILILPFATFAGTTEGLGWLASQANPDGSFGNTPTSLATTVQSTAEVLRAYQILGQQTEPPYAPALAYLNGTTESNTEFLSRKIAVNVGAGNNVTPLVNLLLLHQNADGGFGDQAGYDSSALDTAFALEALAAANQSTSAAASGAVGYLLSRQQPSGGWADGDNEPSVYLTALALRALSLYRYVYSGVAAAVTNAQNFLFAQRTGDTWGETHLTALALTAIVPNLADLSVVANSIAALNAAQSANGSWDDDSYTTALVLQALYLATLPRPDPTVGAVGGRVTDGANGLPLAGVTVSVSGTGSYAGQTDADGRYLINGVKQGTVNISAAKTGYLTVSGAGTVVAGRTLEFSPVLARDPQPVPLVLRGTVTDSASGAPLMGATVHVQNTNFTAQTDANGRFELANVPPGSLLVEVALAGYTSSAFAISAPAGGTVDLGVIALVAGTPPGTTGAIKGTIVDSLSGQPLAGVLVSLSGADNRSGFTDVAGKFNLTEVKPGAINISATLDGYHQAVGSATLAAGSVVSFNVRLVKAADPARVTVTGSVIDAHALVPLPNVLVSVAGSGRTALTAADGSFQIADVPPGTLSVSFSLAGYNGVSYTVAAPNGGLVALGVVALAPTGPIGSNRNPVITSKAPTAASAGQTYAYNVVASDPDGDALTFALGNHPAGMTINTTNGQVRWIPTVEQLGPQTFTVVVIDAQAGRAEEVATVNVSVGASRTYVITDVQTLSGLYVDDVVPKNYVLGKYIKGGSPNFVVGGPPCPLTWFPAGSNVAAALNALERPASRNSLGAQPYINNDIFFDLGQAYTSVTVFPQIDHGPFPQEGIEYTVWGSNDPNAAFPNGWQLGTLMAIYRKGYTVDPSCGGQDETDDYAGLYVFAGEGFRYLRTRADASITIFDTPAHTTWNGAGDDNGLPGWQSDDAEIDAVGGMVCDVKPTANAGSDIVGLTGQIIQFDASASLGNILTYGWDLDGDGTIDLAGAKPTFTFNAGFDGDVTLMVVDDRGCVSMDQVHVTIDINVPRPDLIVPSVTTDAVVTDLQTLQVTGTARVNVRNIGKAADELPALVTVFEDTNHNEVFDAGLDNVLGSLTLPTGVARNGSVAADIPVNGFVTFRDSPLHAMVDSDRRIDEERETNNVGSAANICRIPVDAQAFKPVLKWHWSGSSILPAYNQVMMAPAVAQTNDDNGDGKIDQNDIPDIIFVAFGGGGADFGDAILRIVSGKDGSDLAAVTDTALRVPSYANVAVGDIDGDGLIDIVVPKMGGGLLAFNHNGTLKWSRPSSSIASWTFGGPVIADLDGDGKAEMIYGKTVLDASGNVRWIGSGSFIGSFPGSNLAPASIVADVDLDGRPEVIAGASAYSHTGTLLWQNTTVGDGFSAVGNFNADPYPEIVVVTGGKVYLLGYNGSILWGPVTIPGGGRGGPPTIADMDGDGIPEIGVAGAARYVVFRADGSLLWSAVTQDITSNVTGSTVFDFDGDGKAEVVYADETRLRVYRGATGSVLFDLQNSSGTALEYPVIADVDNDGHADIVVASNRYFGNTPGSTVGIRVFKDQNNGWIATRRIWNQHAYHITNINDDGSVPALEQNSWQTHNTYRLNAFVGFDPLALADLTISALKITPAASGQPVTISARIGNGGAATSSEARVSFYEGDPAAGGVPLGNVMVGPLPAGAYTDIALAGIPNLAGAADIYAVVDADNQVTECRETNNSVRRAVQTQSLFGDITVGTDAPAYGANSPVALQATVMNTSALPGAFRVQLQVEDVAGSVLTTFGPKDIGTLIGGAALNLTESWNTNGFIAGTYRLRGRLLSLSNVLLDESVATFTIRHDPSGASAVSLRTTTDRPVYHTTDRVQIEDLISNLSMNTIVSGATLRITVLDPAGQTALAQDLPLAEFGPGAIRSLLTLFNLTAAPLGSYQVQGTVLESGTQAVLASAQTGFMVVNDFNKALLGHVSVQYPELFIGDAQSCTDQLSLQGTVGIQGLEVHYALVRLDVAASVSDTIVPLDLAPGGQVLNTRSLDTRTLAAGDYACVLQARLDGTLKTLAFSPFVLKEPPIKLAAELKVAGKGRLLVLLDHDKCKAKPDHHADHGYGAKHTAGEGDQHGHGHDDHDGHGDDDHPSACDREPHGPKDAPGLTAQRAMLEKLLKDAGWSYTITDTAEAFTREFLTSGYSVYALLSEHEKLSGTVQKELREAVFRGEGLLVAGSHDSRHHKLHEALGVKFIGHVSKADSVSLNIPAPGLTGAIPLIPRDHPLRVKRLTAQGLGVYTLGAEAGHDRDDDCRDHDRRYAHAHPEDDDDGHDRDADADADTASHRHSYDPEHDECEGRPARHLDAVTLNAYGQGQAAFTGFDLLLEAARSGDTGLAAQLLTTLLSQIHPASLKTGVGSVIPLELSLKNQGIAVDVNISLSLPAGARVIDPGSGQVNGGVLTWSLALAVEQEQKLTAWVRLPDQAGPVAFQATIVASAGSRSVTTTAQLTVNVEPTPGLADIVQPLDALVQADHPDQKALRKASHYLMHAQKKDSPAAAVRDVLKATDALRGITDPVIVALRLELDLWLRHAWQ